MLYYQRTNLRVQRWSHKVESCQKKIVESRRAAPTLNPTVPPPTPAPTDSIQDC
jgi:hypothetical protein